MAEAEALAARQPSEQEIRLVIGASSAGTIFEWYDFFIYGTLAYILKEPAAARKRRARRSSSQP